jgi:hypothetical protein
MVMIYVDLFNRIDCRRGNLGSFISHLPCYIEVTIPHDGGYAIA